MQTILSVHSISVDIPEAFVRSIRPYFLTIYVAVIVAICTPFTSNAQSIQLTFNETPLPDVLKELNVSLGMVPSRFFDRS